jgi:hypothetical protein
MTVESHRVGTADAVEVGAFPNVVEALESV